MTSPNDDEKTFFGAVVNHPEVIAHRGGGGEWPGETIYAFDNANNLPVDVLEMDVHCTRDGELAVIHYLRLWKTTESWGLVRIFKLAKVEELDAGYRWEKDGEYPYRGLNSKGLKTGVPSLRDVFKTFPNARMNIEIKWPWRRSVKPLWELIKEKKMQKKVLVASFSTGALREFRELSEGSVATSASTREWLWFKFRAKYRLLPKKFEPPYQAFQASAKLFGVPLVTKEFVAAAGKFELPVHAWTVNDEQEMERVKAAGVHGIITDYPSLLLKVLGRQAPGATSKQLAQPLDAVDSPAGENTMRVIE